jgi:ATP-binding cassette subfamily B protein
MRWLRNQWHHPRVKLARLLPEISPWLATFVGVTGLIGALLVPGTAVARGLLVGSIPPTLQAGGLSSNAGRATLLALGLVAAIFVMQLVVRSISSGLVNSLSLRVDQHLEQRVMKALASPHGIAHLEGPEIANKISVLQGVGTAGYRPGNAVGGLITRAETWLSGLGSAVILAGFRWWVALGLSAVYIWAARVTLRDYMVLMKLSSGQAPTIRRSHYYRDLAFIPPAAKEIRVFGLGDWLIDHFKEFWYQAMGPLWAERSNRIELGLASIAMSLSSIVAAAYVGVAAINGEFGIGAAAIFWVQSRAFITSVRGTDLVTSSSNMALLRFQRLRK